MVLTSPVLFLRFNILHGRIRLKKEKKISDLSWEFWRTSQPWASLCAPTQRLGLQRQAESNPMHTPCLLWLQIRPWILFYELLCIRVAGTLYCLSLRGPRFVFLCSKLSPVHSTSIKGMNPNLYISWLLRYIYS